MSSFNRRFLLLALPALAACGFEPVYGTGGSANGLRGSIIVDEPTTKNSFDLVARLEERLGRAQSPIYGMTVTLTTEEKGLAISGSNDITRYNLLGTAVYVLRDLGTGAQVYKGTVNTFTAYSASAQPVSTLAAERDARSRLMTALADKITTDLLINSGKF
ncbi:LPS assembly lipoprotein LptE [Litoreibacter janthinus]|uniref:LPS-assembly lipoprotein n=1 Tax=Litoreibacter janthinus TaxID=670154 RepID=A0A1I6G2E1_9RHOB|nr:LPS assembly lipoprotein LptE [Litoreibacter janthinus]SFR36291.1 LPS-assembly lipoprotein [Litoreibacter janthinus]